MSDFPSSYFYVKSQYTGRVLQPVSAEPGSSVGVFEQKHPGTDGVDLQLWTWVEGFLINKETGLVMDVPNGIKTMALLDTHVKMSHRASAADAAPLQLWDYVRGGWLANRDSKEEKMVIDIRHESKKDGAHVHLFHLKQDEGDNSNQKWMFDLPIAMKKNKSEADLKEAHDQVHKSKVHLSHELLASAAAFTAMKASKLDDFPVVLTLGLGRQAKSRGSTGASCVGKGGELIRHILVLLSIGPRCSSRRRGRRYELPSHT